MKPLGVDAQFRVVRYTAEEDRIWSTVESCISAGMTPERFRHEAALAWKYELEERAKAAYEVLAKK